MCGRIHCKAEILMKGAGQGTSVSRPRWDGRRVLFEFADRGQSIACAISRGALEELAGLRHLNSAELLRCFAEVRGRIELMALDRLRARPQGESGLLGIWADDLHDLPPSSAPVAVRQMEQSGQA
jgi:hypothetical protein